MFDISWNTCGNYDETTQEYFCSYCNLTVAGRKHKIVKKEFNSPGFGSRLEDIYYILECPSCNCPTVYEVSTKNTYPFSKALLPVKCLPEGVKEIYDEIATAISAGCYTSSVILARTAIMHIAVEKGAEENKSFKFYVDFLVENGFVPPNANGWIDKIRTMANDSVHKLEIWGKEEAELIGKFLRYLLIFIYELPSSI